MWQERNTETNLKNRENLKNLANQQGTQEQNLLTNLNWVFMPKIDLKTMIYSIEMCNSIQHLMTVMDLNQILNRGKIQRLRNLYPKRRMVIP